jgi:hypothetical protein
LRHIARGGWLAMKKIEGDGVHTVLVGVVERTERVPVARAASCNDFYADLAINQINHRRLRRSAGLFSSIFSFAAMHARFDTPVIVVNG